MAKIALTVKSTYVPGWSTFEGIRECLQNVRDARVMHGVDVDVNYSDKRGVLTMTTRGRSIDTRALLLGFTTKEGRSDAAGHYGEGLKLAMLALVRAGHEMVIRTGEEVWRPAIESSEQFGGEKVLVVHTRKVKPSDEVAIEVGGVTREEWDLLRPKFLFLVRTGSVIETSGGDILQDESYKGKIFVKGIFVQNMDNLTYGYDLKNANVDRDRRMIDSHDAQYECGGILRAALEKQQELAPAVYSAVRTGKVDGGSAWSAQYASTDVVDLIVEQFDAEYGEETIAVKNEDEAQKIRAYGGRAAVVNDSLRTFVERKKGAFHATAEKLSRDGDVVQFWKLSDVERTNYHRALEVLTAHADLSFEVPKPDVATFRDETRLGQTKTDWTGFVVARKVLGDFRETLTTMVHEVAHMTSRAGDGDRRFVDAQEKIWSGIVLALLPAVSDG